MSRFGAHRPEAARDPVRPDGVHGKRFGRTGTLTFAVVVAAAALAQAVAVPDALAQVAPNQVTGLTAVQRDGFTSLSWTPVEGATEYQIVRTPVDAAGVPTGPPLVVGIWQSQRTVTPGSPRFADAGFALGGRYEWRVGVLSPAPGPLSDPVTGTTLPQWGTGPGASLRTQWESSGDATYTSHENELAYTAALDAASNRVRVLEIGRTTLNRVINMLVIGYPTPLATAEEISDSPTIAFNCNVHGNEPQGRESCLIFARMLAFTEDPRLLEILSGVTVLIVPSINGDGRAANTRGNSTGTDLNRDHAVIAQPETKAFAAMLRDYTPEFAIDLHEGDTEDLPILTARHLNVYEPLFVEGKSRLVEGWLYDNAALSGWWAGPYNNGGDSHEGILRNTLGLKNAIGLLAENRPDGGTTRPAEGTQLANRNRKSYGSLWEEFQALEYFWTRLPQIQSLVEESIAFQTANVGRVVLRGSYPWPPFPSVGAGVPATDAPTAGRIIDPAPCGYFLTEEQYSGPRTGGTTELRLSLHGITQQTRPDGHIVRLAQPLRGLIPMLVDGASVPPSPIVAGLRLFECPHVTASPRNFSVATAEETEKIASLTIGNEAVETEEDLNWEITEAVSDCSSPSELDWVGADQTTGTTPASSSTNVALTFSAAGIAGPDTRSGVLCLSSNDAGEAQITIPLELEILDRYVFTGFFGRKNPPALNRVQAGHTAALVFSLGGDFGLDVFADGSPTSQRINCQSKAPMAAPEPATGTLAFDSASGRYTYRWQTSAAWKGQCRALKLTFKDGVSEGELFFKIQR
jgi:hypothetical protein